MVKHKDRRVALYLRVSTSEQTTSNQRRELEAVAERHGWSVVSKFEDAGISGAKGREQRPGLDALMKAVARREVDMVAAWSVDRLGRSLTGLLELLTELHAKKVDLYLHQQGLDTSTPSGRAMFQMMGVFAEFERAMIREPSIGGPGTSTSGGHASRPQVHRGYEGGQPQSEGRSGYAGQRCWLPENSQGGWVRRRDGDATDSVPGHQPPFRGRKYRRRITKKKLGRQQPRWKR